MYKKYFPFLNNERLQLLINKFYRNPRSNFRMWKRFGGYRAYKKMIEQSQKMKVAAYSLPPVVSHPNGLPIYFLTGKDFLYQTLFCIRSLIKQTQEKFKIILVDDGTFDAELKLTVNKLLPNAKLLTVQEINQNLDTILPEEKYPVIRAKRAVYNHLKKLTDIHTYDPTSFKLILDSDMLFWKDPIEATDWLKQPDGVLSIEDSTESYGYSTNLMQKLCGFPITKMLNVGLIGFQSSIINWDKIENWIATLEEKEGPSYFLEQALTAMVVSSHEKELRLTTDEYIVNPSDKQVAEKAGKLHHYVDLSKKPYFISAWKNFENN